MASFDEGAVEGIVLEWVAGFVSMGEALVMVALLYGALVGTTILLVGAPETDFGAASASKAGPGMVYVINVG